MSAKASPADGLPHVLHVQRGAAFFVALAIGWCGHGLDETWQPSRAAADTSRVSPKPVQAARLAPTGPFDEASDAQALAALRSATPVRIKKGSGGRTLAFKLTFADGSAGYWKPEQSVSSANWYAEIAAYELDRALGLGRVPVVVGRRFAWAPFAEVAADDRRLHEVKVGADGMARGALVRWLPDKLVPETTPVGWENWVRVEPLAPVAVTPYQRASAYGAALGAARRRVEAGQQGLVCYTQAPTPGRDDLPAALSDMLLFDFLTLNYDRWGGDNTNILTLGAGGPLIFLDNGDGFSVGPARRSLLDARLAPLQRFRKRTVEAVRALDVDAFARTLDRDPLGPFLDARMLDGLRVRKDAVLQHVATMQRRFGEAVYAW